MVRSEFCALFARGYVGRIAYNRRDDLFDLLNMNHGNGINNRHCWARRLLTSPSFCWPKGTCGGVAGELQHRHRALRRLCCNRLEKVLEINVSAVAEAALKKAVVEAGLMQWLTENAAAFAAQAAWHERNGHPLVDIICAPGGPSWSA